MSVEQRLRELGGSRVYPFHMPGHKRNPAFAFCEQPVRLDVTETSDTDDLHHPAGMLANSMTLAARLTGSRQAFLLVNGSTGGILSGINAAVRRGDTVLVARNSHRSVTHGLRLAGAKPVWLQPAWDPILGVYGVLTVDAVKSALAQHPETKLVLLTSPTYEGVVSDIHAIAQTAHAAGAVLMVDEAHGAHFGYHPAFPASAITQGADIVVQSLHKTLPSPTQTGLLHLCGNRVDPERIAQQLAVFQTSSPSYLLMAGADTCLHLLEQQADELFDAYFRRLTDFRQTVGRLVLPANGDPGKLLIPCENGAVLAARLRREFELETEMSGIHHVLAMTSIADTDEGFERLARALLNIRPTPSGVTLSCPPVPPAILTPADATDRDRIRVPLSDAERQTAASELYAYPPGIPLVLPGEQLTGAVLTHIRTLRAGGVTVHGTEDEKVDICS